MICQEANIDKYTRKHKSKHAHLKIHLRICLEINTYINTTTFTFAKAFEILNNIIIILLINTPR